MPCELLYCRGRQLDWLHLQMNGIGSHGEQRMALKSKGDGTIVKAEDRAVGRVTFQVSFSGFIGMVVFMHRPRLEAIRCQVWLGLAPQDPDHAWHLMHHRALSTQLLQGAMSPSVIAFVFVWPCLAMVRCCPRGSQASCNPPCMLSLDASRQPSSNLPLTNRRLLTAGWASA